MKQMHFYIPFRWLPIVICSLLFALFEAAALRPMGMISPLMLWMKSFTDAFIMVGMGLLLATVIHSSLYVKLDYWQRLVNYTALGVIYMLCWGLLSYLFSLLIAGSEMKEEVQRLLPLTLFIAMLVYIIQLLIIHDRLRNEEMEEAFETDQDDLPLTVEDQPFAAEAMNENGEESLERVAVKSGQKIHVILVPDIVYIQSDGDYVQIVTAQSRYLKEETMKYFEASLPRNRFVRVHRSYIVNVEKILRIELYKKQNQMLTLANGDQIRASVAGYRELRTILNL
ncbi:MAG TPA: LytTR family DNA-binding domain-containing protein [Proteiniphilum sp.]|nr:LytTR family DNA-binding domain-containing protein [Proteiniphilum sp.]HPJ49285.1 LytTR family DNA-binding domain-containing protein [Proteiniphilum sp.]HPR20503.1 LytTR family DNA-binding domain-containing protein [Proteiniphilum sp.]